MRSGSTTSYRSDIDGLRAVAVLPVVLYHSGLTVFSGGFVGVDIFFVISGYLITNIIWTEIRSSDFSILRFYERRARRILPALFVVILATLVAGSIWSLPQQLAGIGASSAAAVLSVSNFYFWSQSGYFSPHAEMLPLLHTWSLGVEEQFYLIFPLGMVLLHRLKLNPPMVIAVAIAPLFAVGVYLSYTMPAVSFYLLPARAWELLIGAVLALGIVPKVHNRSLREAMGIGGLSIIGLAIFMIDPQMRFPGFVALAPCIGAAALIHSGHVPTVASRLLSVRPMVFVGLISYSLYLWHWPLLAFTKMRFAAQHLTPALLARR